MELLQLRIVASDQGIWDWRLIRNEFSSFPNIVRKFLDTVLAYPNFLGLLLLQLLAAILLLVVAQPLAVGFLLASNILISLRWRGTVNGGSDYMTIIVVSAIFIASLSGNNAALSIGACWYVAIQCCSSFFIAGIAKLRTANWRNGRALPGFIVSAMYEPPHFMQQILKNRSYALLISWLLLSFECSFPIVFLNPSICLAYIFLALLFQLANVYIFGLNRFLFVWAATYPALYWCSCSLWE